MMMIMILMMIDDDDDRRGTGCHTPLFSRHISRISLVPVSVILLIKLREIGLERSLLVGNLELFIPPTVFFSFVPACVCMHKLKFLQWSPAAILILF